MYFVKCYSSKEDKSPCLIIQYLQKRSAYKRAEKAMKTFEVVIVSKLDSANIFEIGLEIIDRE